jgi:hypothetical protein
MCGLAITACPPPDKALTETPDCLAKKKERLGD